MLATACAYINPPGLQPNLPVVATTTDILKEAYAMKPGTQKGIIIDHGDGLCSKVMIEPSTDEALNAFIDPNVKFEGKGHLAEDLGINDIRTPVGEIYDQLVEPPQEYDHEYYRGKLIVKRADEHGIKMECWGATKIGCAFFVGEQAQDCLVWIVYDDFLNYQRMSYDTVFRHERGHCNGWQHASNKKDNDDK
jgi:hypothetical protein